MKNKIFCLFLSVLFVCTLCSCKSPGESVITYNDLSEETSVSVASSDSSSDLISSESRSISQTSDSPSQSDFVELSKESQAVKASICVSVLGEVVNPGIYYLEEGSRIYELINAAGGLSENADCSDLNLVYIISDGMQITIPQKPTTDTSAEEKDAIDTIKIYDSQNTEGAVTDITSSSQDFSSNSSAKININKASVEELTNLAGIGQTRAQAIVAYRNQHGNFKSINEIMNVSGIKEGTFDKIKDYICLD